MVDTGFGCDLKGHDGLSNPGLLQSRAVISQRTPCLCFYFKHIQIHNGLEWSPSGRSIILPVVNSIKRFHAWQTMQWEAEKEAGAEGVWRGSNGWDWKKEEWRIRRIEGMWKEEGMEGSWIIYNWGESGCCWKDNGQFYPARVSDFVVTEAN